MKLSEMLPHQLHQALKERWPLFLPAGVIEYHGEHLPLGYRYHCCSKST